MLEELLTHLSAALTKSLLVASLGAFLWGVISILLSPCHLSSVPLLVGFLASQDQKKAGQVLRLSVLFSLGILASIALIGALTAAAGRLLGDLGRTGNAAVALIFFFFGFYLMDLLPLNWGRMGTPARLQGATAALAFGFLFGVGLGPCTFAFMAPVLGVVFARAGSALGSALCLLGAFALGHCGVIVFAGTLTQSAQKYLNWTENHRALKWLRRVCGLLVVLAGIYILRRAVI
jgi:cytochrome c-type biogenesis protein